MAANLADYAENKIVEHSLGKTSWTMPATVRVALFTSNPGETGDLTNEVSGGSYARQVLTVDSASNGVTQNSAEIAFPVATGSWGTVTHVAVTDSATGGAGNVIWYGALTASKTIASGDQFRIAAAALTFTLT